MLFIHLFKIFHGICLTLSPWLILNNQLACTVFGRCEQYTIDLTVYDRSTAFKALHPSHLFLNELKKKMAFMAI